MASNDNVCGSLSSVKALPAEVLRSILWFYFVEFFHGPTEDLNFLSFCLLLP